MNKKYWINITIIVVVMIGVFYLIDTNKTTKNNNCRPTAIKVCENHNMTFVALRANMLPVVFCNNNGEPDRFNIICPNNS